MLASGTVDQVASLSSAESRHAAEAVLHAVNAALAADDAAALTACFFPDQAYWRDQLALTYHLRTFATPSVVAASLLDTSKRRGVAEGIALEGAPQLTPVSPFLVSLFP